MLARVCTRAEGPYPTVGQSDVNPGAFQVPSILTVIVVDGEGEIVGRYVGTVSGIAQQLDVHRGVA